MKKYFYLSLVLMLTVCMSTQAQTKLERSTTQKLNSSALKTNGSLKSADLSKNRKMAPNKTSANSSAKSDGYKKDTDGTLSVQSKYHTYEIFPGNVGKKPVAVINLLDRGMKTVAVMNFYPNGSTLKETSYDEKEMVTTMNYSFDMFDHFKDILESGKSFKVEYNPKEKTACVKTSPRSSSSNMASRSAASRANRKVSAPANAKKVGN